MGVAVSMAAMMAPSAAPFFVAYGRDTRRPAAIAVVVLIYVAAWALIGVAADLLMNLVRISSSSKVVAAAVGLAVLYSFTPWARWGRSRCRHMCANQARESAALEAARYAACCIACSAGIMGALMVVGMTNAVVVVIGAATMFLYKFSRFQPTRSSSSSSDSRIMAG